MKIKNQGFTLIEMMIVVAILGIVTAIAVPSYTDYVRKGKRADAKVELLKIAQLQESYFVQNLSYAKDLTTGAGGLGLGTTVKSEQEAYTISIIPEPPGCNGVAGANACDGFTITATPLGGQVSDKCKKFTITHTGAKGVKDNTAYDAKTCWK